MCKLDSDGDGVVNFNDFLKAVTPFTEFEDPGVKYQETPKPGFIQEKLMKNTMKTPNKQRRPQSSLSKMQTPQTKSGIKVFNSLKKPMAQDSETQNKVELEQVF